MEPNAATEAVRVASRAVRRGGMTPWAFRSAVLSTTPLTQHVRATWVVLHRRAVRKTVPAAGARPEGPLSDPAEVDPWSLEVGASPAVVAVCPSCAGGGTRPCVRCAEARCSACGGAGRDGEGLVCSACEGSGRPCCGCLGGLRSCDTCAGSGTVRAHLEILEEAKLRVLTEGDPGVARGDVLRSWRGGCDDVPVDLVAIAERNRPELRRGERASSVHIEIRASDATLVSFRVAGVDGEIEIRDGAVERALLPGLRVRWMAMASAAFAALGWSLLLLFAYVSRSPLWFAAQPSALGLALLAMVLPVFVAWLVADLCLPTGWRRLLPRALALGTLIAALSAQGQLVRTGLPSMADAEVAFAAGNLDEASWTARAALGLGIEPEVAGDLIDRIAASRFASQEDIALAAQILAEEFHGESARVSAASVLLDRVEERVSADLARGEDATAAELVALLPEPTRSDPRASALLSSAVLLRFDRCVDRFDVACAGAALDEARAQGAPTEHIDAHRSRADAVAGGLLEPLWRAIRNRKNPRRARWEACVAALVPLGLVEAAGTASFQPKPQQVDASCAEIAAPGRAR